MRCNSKVKAPPTLMQVIILTSQGIRSRSFHIACLAVDSSQPQERANRAQEREAERGDNKGKRAPKTPLLYYFACHNPCLWFAQFLATNS